MCNQCHPPCLLLNQDVGHTQSSDGGEGQAQPGGPGQTGRSVAQVGVAAYLGHGVDCGVGDAGGQGRLLADVALGLCYTALLLNVHDTDCYPDTTEALFSAFTCGFSRKAQVPNTKVALVAHQSLNGCKAESGCEQLENNYVHLGKRSGTRLQTRLSGETAYL